VNPYKKNAAKFTPNSHFFKIESKLSVWSSHSRTMAVVSSRGGVNAGIDPFAEHTSIMKALYHDYQRRDELEGVALVEALLHEAAQACKQKEESAKNLVRGGVLCAGACTLISGLLKAPMHCRPIQECQRARGS